MPKAKKASKKGSKSKKGSSRARKSSRKTSTRASVESGPGPPYGVAIREAIARGDAQEMRQLANTTRQWLDEVNEALNRLETSINEA